MAVQMCWTIDGPSQKGDQHVVWQPVLEATLKPVPFSAASCWDEILAEEGDLCESDSSNELLRVGRSDVLDDEWPATLVLHLVD